MVSKVALGRVNPRHRGNPAVCCHGRNLVGVWHNATKKTEEVLIFPQIADLPRATFTRKNRGSSTTCPKNRTGAAKLERNNQQSRFQR
ncbi:hypothetical protein PoB_001516700 [Plakobranchus ocellatus]|uniref:Uncharacterized protein n=1 Tax=Plakobranchus ocellatus TaxID=259542 RepID=A0AAV3Z298_9GAST|nr:hypothetical protein PoB_001516700 [Plakobranchus ocellatus]